MGDDERRSEAQDAELEREIRSRREYSLSEAIGRAAGDLMKGASPVTQRRQAELVVEQYLEEHLQDAEGALQVVLRRRVSESRQLLEQGYERPLDAVVGIVERLLASPTRLRGFVRQVDSEWGRIYSERPHFELGEVPPHPEDPYTVESVRIKLTRLLEELAPSDTAGP